MNALKEKQKRYYMQVCDVESTGCVEGRKGQPRVTTKMERQRALTLH